jgi:predicted Zn-dependent peptidase
MKKIFNITILFLFSLGLSAYEMGDFVRDVIIKPMDFSFPEMKQEKLDDGTEILALPNNDFPIVSAEFHLYYGKKNLGPRKTEILRLLEDSWEFSGSRSFPKDALLQEFEKLGATFSLSLDYEKTIISVSYLKKDEKRVVELLSSFWEESLLDASVVSTMRERIADEIKRRNDNPTGLGMRKMKERVLKSTILGKVSSLEGLGSVTIEELKQFQKEILTEKKRVLLLTGDADVSAWRGYLKLLPIKSGSQEKAEEIQLDLIKKNISEIKTKHILVEKDVSQAFVVMMGSIPRHNDPDFYAVQVLNYIIGGGGFNSYYMREIRNNRGLAYSAGSSADFQKGYGLIHFYAMTKTESVPEVLKLMQDLIQSDVISGLKEDELKRAKVAITNQFVFLFDDSKKVLQNELRFRDHEMPKDYLLHFRENIEKVSLEDLKRVGKKYFDPQSLSMLVVGPKKLQESLGADFKLIQPEENPL